MEQYINLALAMGTDLCRCLIPLNDKNEKQNFMQIEPTVRAQSCILNEPLDRLILNILLNIQNLYNLRVFFFRVVFG